MIGSITQIKNMNYVLPLKMGELKYLGQIMTKEFLDDVSLPNIERLREDIKQLIKDDNIEEINDYIKENQVMLKDLNSEHFDMLIYAIENGVSLETLFQIIRAAQYHVFDYKFYEGGEGGEGEGEGEGEDTDFKTPFLSAICNRRYDVVNFLINNDIDIHHHLIKTIHHKSYNDLINYMCRNKKLNYENLNYILDNFMNEDNEEFYIAPESIYYLIETGKNKEAEILIKTFSLPVEDVWYKKSAKVENFGFIDMAFEYDPRDFNIKSESLQTILAENLHPMKIAEFMKYTKHTKIRDIYRETMMTIFQ
eukprot:jgi/Orpsp1_1/1178036/evm.model.c7180000063800.1